MYGPISDFYGHAYYLNVCSKSHLNHSCFNSKNEPVISYSCQV